MEEKSMAKNLYRLTANGKKWNDRDEVFNITADSPEQAITKARIVRGESCYRRLYMVQEVVNGCRNHIYQQLADLAPYMSYGMHEERMRRDFGRNWRKMAGA